MTQIEKNRKVVLFLGFGFIILTGMWFMLFDYQEQKALPSGSQPVTVEMPPPSEKVLEKRTEEKTSPIPLPTKNEIKLQGLSSLQDTGVALLFASGVVLIFISFLGLLRGLGVYFGIGLIILIFALTQGATPNLEMLLFPIFWPNIIFFFSSCLNIPVIDRFGSC